MLHTKLKISMAIAFMFLSACATAPNNGDLHNNTVKVTNMASNHGGTGIVLRSSDTNSYVLTNSHVCGVVEDGGLVSGSAGQFMVTGYKRSLTHDLCLIKVSGNLGASAKVASRPPELYSEDASISGHPGLMPNVISKGHFSGKDVVTILVGVRACTTEESNSEDTALLCGLLGGIPILKNFQATLVTATIMPGSSGSGVYNSDGELSGVAFAGRGDLGYAWTVPYEYMKNFLDKEQYRIKFTLPNNEMNILSASKNDRKGIRNFVTRLKKVCNTASREKIKELCSVADNDLLK